jgi:16S rRNA (guanine527-N7)-methyltransferase
LERKIWFRTACRQNGIDLTDEQLEKIESYAKLLLRWNKDINLISRRDEGNIWSSHLLHSVSILFKVKIPPAASILDLGTGGGLPGIPLKILLPKISITLLDSTQKKVKVVQEIVEALSLENTTALWGRAEEIGKLPNHQKRYDIIVARAVGPLKDLVRWSWPLLKEGHGSGRESEHHIQPHVGERIRVEPPALIALKGGDLGQEMKAVRHGKRVRSIGVIDLTLKGSTQFEQNDKKIVLVNF